MEPFRQKAEDRAHIPEQPAASRSLLRHLGGLSLTTLLLGTAPFSASAGEAAPSKTGDLISPTTLGENWENLGRIYKSDPNPILQEFWLLGRYHGQ